MATLGEHHPELARRLGVEPATREVDSGYLGKLCIVTFQEPQNPSGTRRDPIGRLPPSYDRFGIVDREYKDRVKAGETWIVRPYTNHTGAIFLLPLDKVELASILALDLAFIQQLAAELVRHRPDLAMALRDLLPGQAPAAPTAELAPLRQALDQSKTALQNASHVLALVHQLPSRVEGVQAELKAALEAIPAPPTPTPATSAPVSVLVRKEKPAGDLPIYVADTNLFINAERWRWEQCIRLLDASGMKFRIAIPRQVQRELIHSYRLPQDLLIVDVPNIDPELRALADANASALGKKAGDTDLSLIQVLLDRPDVRGIITEDPDIRNMHPESIVRKLKGRTVECVNAAEFCENHKKLVVR